MCGLTVMGRGRWRVRGMGGGEDHGMERVYFVVPQPLCVHFPPLRWQMSADYDRLSLLQKVEVFEHALESTRGDDLAKVLWLKSPNSEVDGCTGGTASCAVLSWWSRCVCVHTPEPQVWDVWLL